MKTNNEKIVHLKPKEHALPNKESEIAKTNDVNYSSLGDMGRL